MKNKPKAIVICLTKECQYFGIPKLPSETWQEIYINTNFICTGCLKFLKYIYKDKETEEKIRRQEESTPPKITVIKSLHIPSTWWLVYYNNKNNSNNIKDAETLLKRNDGIFEEIEVKRTELLIDNTILYSVYIHRQFGPPQRLCSYKSPQLIYRCLKDYVKNVGIGELCAWEM